MVELEKALVIPSSDATDGPAVDLTAVEVCNVHGRPAVKRLHLAVPWRPKRDTNVTIGGVELAQPGFGHLERSLENVVDVVEIEAVGWPVCATCRWRRRSFRWTATLMFWGAVVVLGLIALLAFSRGEAQKQFAVPGLLCFPIAFFAVVPFVAGSWQRLLKFRGTPDASAILVENAHPDFRRAVALRRP